MASELAKQSHEVSIFEDDEDDSNIGAVVEDASSSSDEDAAGETTEVSSSQEQSDSLDQEERERREIENLIKRETSNVLTWRETVTGILVIIGSIACVATYVFLGGEDVVSFNKTFQEATLLLSKKYLAETEAVTAGIKVLAKQVAANAIAANVSWPFVTVPFFEVYGGSIGSSACVDLVITAPLVSEADRASWEVYAAKNQGWLTKGLSRTGETDDHAHSTQRRDEQQQTTGNPNDISPYIHLGSGIRVPEGQGPYAPVWQLSPVPDHPDAINLDLFSFPNFVNIVSHLATMTSVENIEPVVISNFDLDAMEGRHANETRQLMAKPNETAGTHDEEIGHHDGHLPRSLVVAPVLDRLLEDDEPRLVGLVAVNFVWNTLFENTLTKQTRGVQVVIRSSCDQEHPFTYILNGTAATYLGTGEEHIDNYYEAYEHVVESSFFNTSQNGGCSYAIHISPTRKLRLSQNSDSKVIFTLTTAGLFGLIGIVFHLYDRSVQKRNEKMLKTAAKSNQIVSSLFPANVKKRLFESVDDDNAKGGQKSAGGGPDSSKPLADFFPEATVLFADIVGFTAWSSVREPSQVFVLLESIYSAFDEIAKRRRIFKIETVGDCYVATAGLPEPRVDHAPAMARFAYECQGRLAELTARLEESLGPDTGDLKMRVGIHSGPVTAGVLRGERARFQLFGDTVNTAARLESSGKPGRIHVSHETAKLLTKAGKAAWLTLRDDRVVAKGKGSLTTYWLSIRSTETSSASSGSRSDASERGHHVQRRTSHVQPDSGFGAKSMRLVNWNVEILARLLKQTVARRRATNPNGNMIPSIGLDEKEIDKKLRHGKRVIEEVIEVITLPKFDAGAANASESVDEVLSDAVVHQLHEFVTEIAKSYKPNPFHNFEHASHVTMSVSKLLSRIVAPKLETTSSSKAMHGKLLHDHTYGITSDPLTQFACIFSALVHDAEHQGVPNAQLVKEGAEIALRYQNQSVAEQNSVDFGWNLLMEPRFQDLRATIYTNEEEMMHFRRLVVNCVMATDICDKHLKDLRNKRWDRAFSNTLESSKDSATSDDDLEEAVNRKATIVIEHLLQASDVSHTMQHWHVFRKWNENLFLEMYFAFREGRAEKDPASFWYQGEIGFFDYYVIPLAKKLSQCGVFGVSSDEYLNYAQSNRNEWEERGREVVIELAAKARKKYAEVYGEEDVGVPMEDEPARLDLSERIAPPPKTVPDLEVRPIVDTLPQTRDPSMKAVVISGAFRVTTEIEV